MAKLYNTTKVLYLTLCIIFVHRIAVTAVSRIPGPREIIKFGAAVAISGGE